MFFVVNPVFFGWEDLAEEKQEQEKEGREKLDFFFPPGTLVSSHRRNAGYVNKNSQLSAVKSSSDQIKAYFFAVKIYIHC